MKKCIIFDIDRTIVDSFEPEILSLTQAIENVTKNKITKEQLSTISSLPTKESFKRLNLDEHQIQLVKKEWEITFSKYQIKCFPEIKEEIKYLHKQGYQIGIITARTKEEFEELQETLQDIIPIFDIIVTSDLVNNPKPEKDSFYYLCNELKITKDDIIYIGDSITDKKFANNCEITFIPACWENQELIQEKHACLTPKEITTKIKKWNK